MTRCGLILMMAPGVRAALSAGWATASAGPRAPPTASRDSHHDGKLSRVEQPHDLLLSTLNSYRGAIGGRAIVIVTFADGRGAILDLSQLP
jgi:hypothetical protein